MRLSLRGQSSHSVRADESYQDRPQSGPHPSRYSDSSGETLNGGEEDVEKSDVEDGSVGDPEKQTPNTTPVGFWHPSLKHVRREAAWKWCLTTTILMASILGILSIYWGAFFRIEQNMSSLVVYVVDFDAQVAPYNTSDIQPLVGPTIVQLANDMVNSGELHVGFGSMPPSAFDYDPIQVRQAVYDWKAWAAIIINANATAMLYSAVENGNSSYDPIGACQLVFQDSRDDTNWYDYLAPQIIVLMTNAQATVGAEWTRMVMQNATTNSTLAQNVVAAPQALSPAIGFSEFNLRPFFPLTTTPAVSIGLIYLIIISFFSFAFYLPIHFKYLKPNEGHAPLKFWQLIVWRWCSTVLAYFFLSLAYSFISLAFQINFSGGNPVSSETEVTWTTDGYSNPDAYGKGSFPVYWMLNFIGMIALGLACENVAMLVGNPWTGLWLIFWVISNVSTAFYDIDVEPGFYYYGYGFPLHYIVEGSRQILFDLHSRIGLDFGVLIAWGAVNTALFPFACLFMRWKQQHNVHEYYT